ncbi:MAG: hypothetical protein AB2735_14420, partial [Candidatus Thiodiazotropha taylori]
MVRVSALLKALILEAAAIGNDYRTGTPEARLMLVILDQLKKIERFPLYLPFSAEPRVRRVTDNMIANPADNRTLAGWALQIGASERTLGRLFMRHLGMSFAYFQPEILEIPSFFLNSFPSDTLYLTEYLRRYSNLESDVKIVERSTVEL